MPKLFQTGNVIKTHYGSIEIVTDVTDDYTKTISFDYTNSSAGHRNKTHKREEQCWDCYQETDEGVEHDKSCKICKGTGYYKKTIYGMDKAKLLGSNVKEYIINRLTKNFEF